MVQRKNDGAHCKIFDARFEGNLYFLSKAYREWFVCNHSLNTLMYENVQTCNKGLKTIDYLVWVILLFIVLCFSYLQCCFVSVKNALQSPLSLIRFNFNVRN